MISRIPRRFLPRLHSSMIRSDIKHCNLVSALFSVKFIVIIVVALFLPNWYFLKGSSCTKIPHPLERYFYIGSPKSQMNISSHSSSAASNNYCITREVIFVQVAVVTLCVLATLFSLWQYYADVVGVKNEYLLCWRRFAMGNIFSAIIVVIVLGLCYVVSDVMETQQSEAKLYPTSHVEVTFGISYYLIATSGIVAVLATACNLVKCENLRSNSLSLLDDCQDDEIFSVALPHSHAWVHFREQNNLYLNNFPPPPPYIP